MASACLYAHGRGLNSPNYMNNVRSLNKLIWKEHDVDANSGISGYCKKILKQFFWYTLLVIYSTHDSNYSNVSILYSYIISI